LKPVFLFLIRFFITQKVDILLSTFFYKEEIETLVSYPYLIPSGKILSILSCPLIKYYTDNTYIFKAFSKEVWISLIFSYLIMIFLNYTTTRELRIKNYIAIDYLAILIGKGKIKFEFY
jgi:Na+/H+-translocating membrane pyrophosphatase